MSFKLDEANVKIDSLKTNLDDAIDKLNSPPPIINPSIQVETISTLMHNLEDNEGNAKTTKTDNLRNAIEMEDPVEKG